jgi:uncharacterized protein
MGNSARQHFPDEVRGLALMGILWVNVPYLAISAQGFDRAINGSVLDQAIEFLVAAVFQTKFYLLFSFLFGYSAHLILSRSSIWHVFARRLVGLAILGVLHAVFFFAGDILLTYALLGTALLFANQWKDATLKKMSATTAVATALWILLLIAIVGGAPSNQHNDQSLYRAFNDAAAQSSFLDLAQARLTLLPTYLLIIGSLQWGYALACFFLGFLAGRHALLSEPERHKQVWRFCRRLGYLGFPLTLAGAWLIAGLGSIGAASLQPRELIGTLLVAAAAPLVTASYLGLLVTLRARFSDLLRPFRSVGRMSLTTYLLQSVLLCLVFCGWGLGLFGQVSNTLAIMIGMGVYICLALAASLWLARFEQGPMEWLMKWWVSAEPKP